MAATSEIPSEGGGQRASAGNGADSELAGSVTVTPKKEWFAKRNVGNSVATCDDAEERGRVIDVVCESAAKQPRVFNRPTRCWGRSKKVRNATRRGRHRAGQGRKRKRGRPAERGVRERIHKLLLLDRLPDGRRPLFHVPGGHGNENVKRGYWITRPNLQVTGRVIVGRAAGRCNGSRYSGWLGQIIPR